MRTRHLAVKDTGQRDLPFGEAYMDGRCASSRARYGIYRTCAAEAQVHAAGVAEQRKA